jgi:hypothetical protein
LAGVERLTFSRASHCVRDGLVAGSLWVHEPSGELQFYGESGDGVDRFHEGQHVPSMHARPSAVLAFLALSAPFSLGAGWSFADAEGYRDVLLDGKPVLRHMNAWDPARRNDTFKPYIHVFAFDGKTLLTKGPGGKFTHHRGAFIGWNKTEFEGKSYDFWHCKGVERKHAKYVAAEEKATADQAVMVSVTDWPAPDGRMVISEKQTITSRLLAPGKLQLDFAFELTAPSGPVRLNGDPQHAGFHYRAAEEVERHEKDTRYLRPPGAQDQKSDIWADCPWVVCDFTVEEKRYSVMHMSAPGNPAPSVYSTRAYGRFGNFFTAEVKPGMPLKLNFRLLVEDQAAAAREDWPARYAEWTASAAQ